MNLTHCPIQAFCVKKNNLGNVTGTLRYDIAPKMFAS